MKVLVACEESQAVTIELRKLGHEAYSCDIEPCSGGHPEWHIQYDVISLLNGDCAFNTVTGESHKIIGTWDMIIAFPPCTYFSVAGANRLYPQKGVLNQERYRKGLKIKRLFMAIWNANCPRIAIENPVPMKVWDLPTHTQQTCPSRFGHAFTKKTRLWLKGLLPLQPTNIIVEGLISWVSGGSKDHKGNPRKQSGTKFRDAKTRSKTFPGIAKAMAEQWAGEIKED